MSAEQRKCPEKRFLWCFVNKRFQNCCSYPARYCVLCDGRMGRRKTGTLAEQSHLNSQISTRGHVSNVCTDDTPCASQPGGVSLPHTESLIAAGDPLKSAAISLGLGNEQQDRSRPDCPGEREARPSSSNPRAPSAQAQGSQDTSSASDCVLVSTECPKTAKGRPAAAKQLKAEIKALQSSSTPYYQSPLPDTQRVSVQDLECLAASQWLPVRSCFCRLVCRWRLIPSDQPSPLTRLCMAWTHSLHEVRALLSGVLNTYLSILQARHALSRLDGAPTVHTFSTFFFSKLLEGVTLDSCAHQGDPDWCPGQRRSQRKRKGRQTPKATQPPPKRIKRGKGGSCQSSRESKAASGAAEQHMHELLTVNYDAVRAWTAKTRPLQFADILVVPVNESNSHWLTVVISVSRKEIVLLDSLFSLDRSEEYRRMLLKVWAWILLEASDKLSPQLTAPSNSGMPSATELNFKTGADPPNEPVRTHGPQNGAREAEKNPERLAAAGTKGEYLHAAQRSHVGLPGSSENREQQCSMAQNHGSKGAGSSSQDTPVAAAALDVSGAVPETPSVQPSSQAHGEHCSEASPASRPPGSNASGSTAGGVVNAVPTNGSYARSKKKHVREQFQNIAACSKELAPHHMNDTRLINEASQGGGQGPVDASRCSEPQERAHEGHLYEQRGPGNGMIPALTADISDSLGSGGWSQGWRLRAVDGAPQQRDGGSCGVFLLAFTDCVMRGWWPPKFTPPAADTGGCTALRSTCVDAGDKGRRKSDQKVTGSITEGSKIDSKHASQCSNVQEMHGSAGPAHQPVGLEFGEVAALRLGLLQELTGRE